MTELELLQKENDKLRAQNAEMRDALFNVDRYFGAKTEEYFCDVDLCEQTAIYAVDKALASNGSRVEELATAANSAERLAKAVIVLSEAINHHKKDCCYKCIEDLVQGLAEAEKIAGGE